MFRPRVPQGSLLESEFLVPPAKAKRLQKTWAEEFRSQALPLIDEKPFAHMYCEDNGRPNRAVQTLLGVLILKEFGDLTDGEALEQLEFNLLWHYALQLTADESHLPQKTVHNFRARLIEHDGGRVAFCETTDRIIAALGIRTGRQRLDSTHIMSNMAILTRLGLFCETIRLFLRSLRQAHPGLRRLVPERVAGRYQRGRRAHELRGCSLHYGAPPPFGLRPGPLPAGGTGPAHACRGDGGGRAPAAA